MAPYPLGVPWICFKSAKACFKIDLIDTHRIPFGRMPPPMTMVFIRMWTQKCPSTLAPVYRTALRRVGRAHLQNLMGTRKEVAPFTGMDLRLTFMKMVNCLIPMHSYWFIVTAPLAGIRRVNQPSDCQPISGHYPALGQFAIILLLVSLRDPLNTIFHCQFDGPTPRPGSLCFLLYVFTWIILYCLDYGLIGMISGSKSPKNGT